MSTAHHWDEAYGHDAETLSWSQPWPGPSLGMVDAAGVTAADSVVDVGGGASTFVDALLARGHIDLTVLDLSAEGMRIAQRRLGERAATVRWLVADLRTWLPARTYRVWHDRAVLHFLTDETSRRRYLSALTGATAPGSLAIIAAFAPDGPQQCSGLPVRRYSTDELSEFLGDPWQRVHEDHEQHSTPGGARQSFIWTAFRRLT